MANKQTGGHINMQIEPYAADQLEAVIRLALQAWEPVFASLQSVMDTEVYREFYPDWRESQHKAVADVCRRGHERLGCA